MRNARHCSIFGKLAIASVLAAIGLQLHSVHGTTDAVITVGGAIAANATWTTGNIYVVQNNVTVNTGVTLIIQPGVIVKFAANKLLGVNGVLKIQGTAGNPVILTSLKDDTAGGDTNNDGNATAPDRGDWGHIGFFDSSVDSDNLIEYAVIRYGGYFDNYCGQYYGGCGGIYEGVIRFDSASPTVRNNTITQNKGYALSANVDSFPVVNGNALSLNTGNGLEIRGGTLSAPSPVFRRWNNTDVVYVLTNHTTVASGVTLAIDPGVIVKFAANKLLGVNGVLKIQGVASNPVILTSLKDDTAGGDTNNDGNATAPDRGDWGHVGFFDSSVDADSLIEYAILRYGGYFDNYCGQYYGGCGGIYEGVIRLDSASPTIRNNTITQNKGYALSANIDAFPSISGNSLSLNPGNGLEIRGGALSAPSPIVRRWNNVGIVYIVTGLTTVASGVTLAIDPGVIVKFTANNLLGVNGVIKIQGTAASPVILTSLKDDSAGGDTNNDGNATAPDRGDWGHIAFLDASVDADNLIEHAIIRYGGYFDNYCGRYYGGCGGIYEGAIRFDSASPTVRNNTITQNKGYALSASVDSFPAISGNLLSLNFGNGLEIRGGTLSAPSPVVRRWNNTGIVYVLTNNTTVASGVTLAIDPGVIVKFTTNKLLGVNGVLKIQGTAASPVVLTSLKDDTAGGDTNNDGNATAPDRGDWGQISFLDPSVDADNLVEYVILRYGGYFDNYCGAYYGGCGGIYEGVIRFHSASPTIRNNTIVLNQSSFGSREGSLPTIQNNLIIGSKNYAFQNEDNTVDVDARNNWWGDVSGPYHPTTNPNGRSGKVSDHVLYSPWNTSTPALTSWILPGIGGAVFSPNGDTSVIFGPNAVSEITVVTFTLSSVTNQYSVNTPEAGGSEEAVPGNLADTNHVFRLTAQTLSGAIAAPIAQITIRYTDSDIRNVSKENQLSLYRRNGSSWNAITSNIDVTKNILTSAVTADGEYAMFGPSQGVKVFLPLIRR